MKVVSLASLLFAGTVLAQTQQGEATDSPDIAEAFAEFDALSAAIAGRLQDLAQQSDQPLKPPPPGLAPPTPVVVPPADHVDAAGPPSPPTEAGDVGGTESPGIEPQAGQKQCGTREDMDLRVEEVEERFGGFKQAIVAANGDLPTYRAGGRDKNKACTPQFEGSIASVVNRLRRLDIKAVYDVAVELLACVDQRRRAIDEKLNQPDITPSQTRHWTDELHRLTDATDRVQDIERALLGAVSKRRRLVEELTQIKQVIPSVCDT